MFMKKNYFVIQVVFLFLILLSSSLSYATEDCKAIAPDRFLTFSAKLKLPGYNVDKDQIVTYKSPKGHIITLAYKNGAIIQQMPYQDIDSVFIEPWKKIVKYKLYHIGNDSFIVSSFYVGRKFNGEKFAHWLKETPVDFDAFLALKATPTTQQNKKTDPVTQKKEEVVTPPQNNTVKNSHHSTTTTTTRTTTRIYKTVQSRTVVIPPPVNYVPIVYGRVPFFVVGLITGYVIREYVWPWPPYPFDDPIYWASDNDLSILVNDYDDYIYDEDEFDPDDYIDSKNDNSKDDDSKDDNAKDDDSKDDDSKDDNAKDDDSKNDDSKDDNVKDDDSKDDDSKDDNVKDDDSKDDDSKDDDSKDDNNSMDDDNSNDGGNDDNSNDDNSNDDNSNDGGNDDNNDSPSENDSISSEY